jgi:hypothetical protein
MFQRRSLIVVRGAEGRMLCMAHEARASFPSAEDS